MPKNETKPGKKQKVQTKNISLQINVKCKKETKTKNNNRQKQKQKRQQQKQKERNKTEIKHILATVANCKWQNTLPHKSCNKKQVLTVLSYPF